MIKLWRTHVLRVVIAAMAAILTAGVFAVVSAPSADASVSCKRTVKSDRTITTCTHLSISNRQFDLVYGDSVRNRGSRSVKMLCKSESSTTFSWHLDGSVSSQAGAIFAKVSVSVSGGIAHSVTSSYGASVEVSVPGKTTINCDRGIYWYSFSGSVVTTECRSGYCSTSTKKFKGVAPQRNQWRIYKA